MDQLEVKYVIENSGLLNYYLVNDFITTDECRTFNGSIMHVTEDTAHLKQSYGTIA